MRDLRNHGGEALDRVARGERLTVTRDGTPVAQLVPLPRPAVSPAELVARRKSLPRVDYGAMRAEIDAVIAGEL